MLRQTQYLSDAIKTMADKESISAVHMDCKDECSDVARELEKHEFSCICDMVKAQLASSDELFALTKWWPSACQRPRSQLKKSLTRLTNWQRQWAKWPLRYKLLLSAKRFFIDGTGIRPSSYSGQKFVQGSVSKIVSYLQISQHLQQRPNQEIEGALTQLAVWLVLSKAFQNKQTY